ncbi:MAG TPA: NDP-sugar synthase, partial [Solirubrobacterales bacterium]
GDGRVLEFLEKTGEAVPGEINAGAYVLERSVLDLVPAGQAVSIEREVFPRLVGEGLYGLLLDGYWMDIGTPERYLQASWDILEDRVETRVEPTAPGQLIADGATIAGEVGPRAVVAAGCEVAAGAEVSDSVLLDGCTIGADARVQGSILAPGARVEPAAQLVNAVVGRDERVSA